MNSNCFKKIFIILITLLILVAIYITFFNKDQINKIMGYKEYYKGENIISDNIRIGIIGLDNMNPIVSNNKNVQDISRLIFDPLFNLTEDYKLEPALALECSKLNDVTYIIKLRENVKWQDGNKFDVSDVMFTINMLKRKDINSVYSYNVSEIVELQEIDEYTLKLIINEETPYFEYNLIFPIISSKYFNENNIKLEKKNVDLPGTGMFYISNISNETILLKKNKEYWNNKKIVLDSIEINLYNSLANVINAYKDGYIDMFTTSNINIDEYLKNINHNKYEYINRDYTYIVLNCANNILSNKEVRQAINLAINIEEIIKEVSNGKYIKSNFPLDYGSYAYDNNKTNAYNKELSKNILVEKGWKYTNDKWTKLINSRYVSIELTLLLNKENLELIKVARNIKEQLESIGIKINIVELASREFDKCLKENKYNIVLNSKKYGYSPDLNKYFNEGNLANFNNEEINKILNNIESIYDENQLKQECSRIMQIYNDEVPYISLYYNTNTMIYTPNLKGTIRPNSYNIFYNIDTWYREYKK